MPSSRRTFPALSCASVKFSTLYGGADRGAQGHTRAGVGSAGKAGDAGKGNSEGVGAEVRQAVLPILVLRAQ